MNMLHQSANDAKASFDSIYIRPDPRDYFSVLGSLDYSIPDLAKPIFRQIASAFERSRGKQATILDLGSSYGINAALFRYPLTFRMLQRRYARREMLVLSSERVRDLDTNYYRAWPQARGERIIVADVSSAAVAYAAEVGLAEAGIAASLEEGVPTPDVARTLADVDLVMSTGCVGYVTEKTFQSIFEAARKPPWVASFCLRMFDYEPVADALSKYGLVTEKMPSAAFVQRRFRDEAEAGDVLDVIARRGLDPTGLEAEGLLMAELFVSRPAAEARAAPLEEVVTVTSGRNIAFGPRLIQVGKGRLSPVQT